MRKQEFNILVQNFLQKSNMSESSFGLRATNNPNFAGDLRRGRECREATQQKVIDFMRAYAAEHGIDFDVEGRLNA